MSISGKCACALVVVTSFLPATRLIAQDMGQASPEPTPAVPSPEELAAGQKAWMEFMTPGPEHAQLAKFAGDWDVELTDHMAGGVTSICTAKMTMILGGRYLQQELTGQMMGMPFNGLGVTGFDNIKKVYVSTWIDSAGTGISLSEGKLVAPNKIEYVGTMTDPISKSDLKMRMVAEQINDDSHTFNMYMKGPDGKEMLGIEFKYSRKKA